MTLNLGDYESVRPVIEVEDDVLDGENVKEAYSRIRVEAEEMFMEAHEVAKAAKKG